MTCCFLPHNIFPISDSFIIILPAFPIMLHFAVLPILFRLFCLLFSPPFIFHTLCLSWVQCQKSHWPNSKAIPYHLRPHHNCPSVFMEPCHPVLGWETGKGIIFSTSLYSSLSISRGILLPLSLSKQPEVNSDHYQISNSKKSVWKETQKNTEVSVCKLRL